MKKPVAPKTAGTEKPLLSEALVRRIEAALEERRNRQDRRRRNLPPVTERRSGADRRQRDT